jgi:hypothetical protein
MEDLYEIHRMMFVGNGFGFEDLDESKKLELLNKVFDFVKLKIKEHEAHNARIKLK